jgi:hypothetical protein
VIIPLALPGVIAGSVFTLSLTLGDYVTPLLVGGATSGWSSPPLSRRCLPAPTMPNRATKGLFKPSCDEEGTHVTVARPRQVLPQVRP